MAHVLAQAVRAGEVAAADALRILRHELRRRNTNQTQKIATRSTEAQRVIDHYGAAKVPKNASPDALHADHVYSLTEDELRRNDTLDLWISAMDRLRMVVCVTATENYRLETFERAGVTGPDKYARADVTFTTSMLPWRIDPQGALRLSDVPTIDAPWEQIAEFAGTFDGYAHFGEDWGERLSAVRERYLAIGDLPSDLDDLRGCLFLEFRSDRFAWGDDVMLSEPDEHGVRHIMETRTSTIRRPRNTAAASLHTSAGCWRAAARSRCTIQTRTADSSRYHRGQPTRLFGPPFLSGDQQPSLRYAALILLGEGSSERRRPRPPASLVTHVPRHGRLDTAGLPRLKTFWHRRTLPSGGHNHALRATRSSSATARRTTRRRGDRCTSRLGCRSRRS